MKQILFYLGDQQEKKEGLIRALTPIHIPFTFLEDDALSQTIASLLNHEPGHAADTPLHFAMDLMFFDEVSDDEIKDLNARMKEEGITMPRKAMKTIHNEGWLLKDLLKEIQEEHEYFVILEQIHSLLQASAQLPIKAFTEESWAIYEQAFYQAYDVLQKQTDKDTAKKALSNLLLAKDGLTLKKD